MLLITPVMVGSNCAEKVSAWPLAELRYTPVIVLGATSGCAGVELLLPPQADKTKVNALTKVSFFISICTLYEWWMFGFSLC
ncbi:hypothetical protein M2G44_12165 [Vibrio vulnificus]|nr:hypothetical protein [Vibrio vulnificus]MCU8333304.1 hypothetical protein [Vibrio vulnificus]MCU8411321.1 hypothetical protein [Vibrio vulnificus]